MATILNSLEIGARTYIPAQSILNSIEVSYSIYSFRLVDAQTNLPIAGYSVNISDDGRQITLLSDSSGVFKTEFYNPSVSIQETDLYLGITLNVDYYDTPRPEEYIIQLQQKAGIQEIPDNTFNFIRFHRTLGLNKATSTREDLNKVLAQFPYKPSNKFDKNGRGCGYAVTLIEGEDYSIQNNFLYPNSIDLSVDIYEATRFVPVAENFTPVMVTQIGSEYVYSIEFQIPTLSEGEYQFCFYDSSTLDFFLITNVFVVQPDNEYRESSVFLDYRNSVNRNNFIYNGGFSNFRNKIRVALSNVNTVPEYEQEEPYFEETTEKLESKKQGNAKASH